jgi:hypothetical protein
MDIKDLYTAQKHEEGAECQIHDESGNFLDMYIRVVGLDSDKWRTAMRETKRRILTDSKDDREKADYELDQLVDATLDWRGFMSDGEELKFSKKRVRDLYKNAPYIRDQVDRFIAERANFTQS